MSHDKKKRRPHGHDGHNTSKRPPHKDWRLWTVVGLMLLSMLIYVLTLDEALVPADVGPSVPAVHGGQ